MHLAGLTDAIVSGVMKEKLALGEARQIYVEAMKAIGFVQVELPVPAELPTA